MFTKARKAVVGAVVAAAGTLVAGWLSGHHLNWVEGLDAALTTLAAYVAVYQVSNKP